MPITVTRRDLLKLAGGSMLGMLFTPVPWKLLDDTSIWTQNWSLIPRVPRGPISFKYSACTLCPAGCAIKARCVSGIPVSVAGVRNHPLTHGTLCPMGFVSHTMPYHPLRISRPQRFSSRSVDGFLQAITLDQALAAMTAAFKSREGSVAILDRNPGRVISRKYRELEAANLDVLYLTSAASEDLTLVTLSALMQSPQKRFAFDCAHAKRIISFGAPLLDGWGIPGHMNSIFGKRHESGLQLIQVEGRQSRTALQADRWLPIKVGTEGILALGLANILLRESLCPKTAKEHIQDFEAYSATVSKFNPETVASLTGLRLDDIIETARDLAKSGPSIAIAGADPGGGPLDRKSRIAVAGLNVLLSSVGGVGGIVPRELAAPSKQIEDVPDHSLSLLVIDEAESGYALPWSLIERKLVRENSLVVSLSPVLSGLAAHADIIIPAPAPYESVCEVRWHEDPPARMFALSAPLFAPREGSVEPYEIARRLAGVIGASGFEEATFQDVLKKHVASIHASKKGSVFSAQNASLIDVSSISSADELWSSLLEGGMFTIQESRQTSFPRFHLTGNNNEIGQLEPKPIFQQGELAILPFGWRGAVSSSVAPIMSKLFQESNLRDGVCRLFVAPGTASARGISAGDRIRVSTGFASIESPANIDSSVQPDVIEVAVGPPPNGSTIGDQFSSDDVLALSSANEDGTWRLTRVSVAKV